MIDEREEKNVLEFASSEDENNILIENDYESLYTDICKENFFLIFFKIYNKKKKALELITYDFFDKNSLVSEIRKKVENDVATHLLNFDTLTIYKENLKYEIEKLEEEKFELKINQVFESWGIVIVDDQECSVENYFLELKNNGFVTFISAASNTDKRSLLKLSTTYEEIIEHIKINFEEFQEVDPDNILLKAKLKRNAGYMDIINSEDKKLEDFIKFDDKIYVEFSIIKIGDLESQFLLKIQFYYHDNSLSKINEISLPKNTQIKNFYEDIESGKIDISEICPSKKNKTKNLLITVLDSKQNRIHLLPKPDTEIYSLTSKGYNLRLEYDLDANLTDEFFYIYCTQFTKTNDLIPNPFLLKASKLDSCTEIRKKILELLQMKKFEFEKKPIVYNEEYFNKLKIYLKFDINTSISKAIILENNEKEFYSFKKAENENEDKFYIEIIHPSLVSRNSTKALKIN